MSFRKRNIPGFIATVLAVAAVAFFLVTSTSCSRSEPPQPEKRRVSSPSTPLMDQDAAKVVPLEELNINLKDPEALSIQADQYFDARNYAQAAELYEKAIELNPQDIDSYNDLGLAYHYTGRSSRALEVLKKGTSINPSYQRIWLSYGFVLISTGKSEEAKPALGKVIELNPVNDIGQEAQRMLANIP